MPACRYCSISPDDAWAATEFAFALPTDAPFVPGHVAVIPRRHVAGFYELDVQEQRAVWDMVGTVKYEIMRHLRVNHFHVGFADATPGSGGHALVHVVPNAPDEVLDLPASVEWVQHGPDEP